MIRLVIVATFLFAVGCTIVPTNQLPLVDDFEQYQNRILALEYWDIRARVSFREGSRAEISRLYWQRRGEVHKMEFTGGFGTGILRVEQNPSGAIIQSSEGDVLVGQSIEEILAEKSEWKFPVAEITSWIVGLPHAGMDYEAKWNERGYLASVRQSQWLVQLYRYREFDSYVLPTRLRILTSSSSETSSEADSEVRIVISSWEVG